MKVKQLIQKLQIVEKARPNLDVCFESAESLGNGFSTEELHLLDVHAETSERTCYIALGNAIAKAEDYKAYVVQIRGR